MVQDFAGRIKAERERIGLRSSELALKIDVARSHQSLVESGKRKPSVYYLFQLSLLGMDINYIITGQRHSISPIYCTQKSFNSDLDDFFVRLKEEREKTTLTAQEFAALGGAKRSTQFNYEKGAKFPGIDYLIKLYRAGVDINYIVTGKRSTADPMTQALIEAFYKADTVTKQAIYDMLNINLNMAGTDPTSTPTSAKDS